MTAERFAWILLVLLPGCGLALDFDPPDTLDAATLDAGGLDAGTLDADRPDADGTDAGTIDAGTIDAGTDAGATDAGPPPGCGDGITTGDELCDDGNTIPGDGCEPSCRPTCASDTECVAPSPCSVGVCVAGFGCSSADLDLDGDGWVAAIDRSCGDDCDDGDASIHPGAPELCDGIDQSCDGMIDEGVLSRCLQDLDGDGWGSPFEACECPPPPPRGGGDCQDIAGDTFSRLIRPGQPNWFTEPYTRIDGTTSFDFDCSGTDERDFDEVFVACMHDGFGCRGGGWVGTVADCGVRTDFVFCLPGSEPGTCEENLAMQTQPCH